MGSYLGIDINVSYWRHGNGFLLRAREAAAGAGIVRAGDLVVTVGIANGAGVAAELDDVVAATHRFDLDLDGLGIAGLNVPPGPFDASLAV
ncbi:MAG: hypothetical protein JW878_06535, partial [Methanomicrobia archaeon]|nr:hypothetical protein [Methanomicrobia archaeon]